MGNESFSEKVSVNINSSTLSSIDLLVDNGYYSNRSDFINQAVRTAVHQHQSTIDRIIDSNTASSSGDPWFIGVYGIDRRDIERDFEEGKRWSIRGYGVLVINSDCPEDQLFAVIETIRVRGKVICSASVKQHYGLK